MHARSFNYKLLRNTLDTHTYIKKSMSTAKMKESAKMKGLLKGLRYISQIFDEEKDEEMQIGLPTDVKHVAHIGWDGPATGPAVDSSPSWMKEFSSTTGFSAPLGPPPDSKEGPEIKWVSEDSKRGQNRAAGGGDSPKKEHPELPRSTRRHHHHNNSSDSPKKTKPRQSRRQQAKDALDSVLKSGSSQESTSSVPGVPRKSRRKKSKEVNSAEGSTKSSRTKGSTSRSTENVPDPSLDSALPKDNQE